MENKRLVVIAGNGLSQACSDEFGIARLSERLREELKKDDVLGANGLKIADGLASYLDGSELGSEPGFEQLVGAFDSLRRSIILLRELKDAGSPLADAIGPGELSDIEAFCERVYRRGTAAALLAIEAAASIADTAPMKCLTEALLTLGRVNTTFATLSYDTVLMRVLSERAKRNASWNFADMADKPPQDDESRLPLFGDASKMLGHRNQDRLVHLHGSVQFWRAIAQGCDDRHVKIADPPDKRKLLLEAYGRSANGNSQDLIAPLVIYGNQRDKSVLADKPPFSVAYEVLRADLKVASGVLVVGYSFEDAVLNKAVSESLAINSGLKGILVVTQGDKPDEARVNREFGVADRCSVVVLGEGIAGDAAIGTPAWDAFVSSLTQS